MIISGNHDSINYAKAAGIDSFVLALVFAIVYVPLFVFYSLRWFKNTTYVLGAATFFCIVRTVAFGIRAALAKLDSAAHQKNLVLAEMIIYSVGFFGVLSSAYVLVLDREAADGVKNRSPLARISGNRNIIRIVLLAAVVAGIIGSIYENETNASTSKLNTGQTLRKASIIIFLVVSILLVVHSAFSLVSESTYEKAYSKSVGYTHGIRILLVAGLILVVREVFYAATMNNIAKQEEEKLFYPFSAGTELVVVLMFAIPGLVPPKQRLVAMTYQ